MSLPSEQEIVQQLLAGSEAMFRQVVETYGPSMYAVARSIAGDANADEVVQEAWVSAYRALPKFEGRSALKSWLIRIVANEAKTRLRKLKREFFIEDMTQSMDDDSRFAGDGHWQHPTSTWHTDSPDSLLTTEELKDCIGKNMAKLPENQLVVLELRESQGHSLEEICNILDVSSSNVRVLLHRAKDKILQVIDHFERTGKC